MYNMLGLDNGKMAVAFLQMAGLEPGEIPRFRDCYPSKNGKTIVVYTRTGGNNREEYEEELEALYNKDNFINDYDDDFDDTYMSLEFSPLPKWKSVIANMVSKDPQVTQTGAEKFKHVLETLRNTEEQ